MDTQSPTLPSEVLGTPVKSGEVATYAKRGCSTCYGKGVLSRTYPGHNHATMSVCACAVRRFLRSNPGVTTTPNGQWIRTGPDMSDAVSQDSSKTALAQPGATFDTCQVSDPCQEANAPQNASQSVLRLSRLLRLREVARENLNAVQDNIASAIAVVQARVEAQQNYVQECTNTQATLHYTRSANGTRITRLEEEIAGIRQEQARLEAENQALGLEEEQVEGSLNRTRAILRELAEEKAEASKPFRPLERQHQERVIQLDKRIVRLKGQTP